MNHAEIWLLHYKKHASKPGLPYDDAVEEAVCFGWIDGIMRRIDEEKYALRYSPRKSGSIGSETNKKRAERMIEQGRMTDAGLAASDPQALLRPLQAKAMVRPRNNAVPTARLTRVKR